jgi:hypothetical protein
MRVAGFVGCPACLLATGLPWTDRGSFSGRAVSTPRTAGPAITPSARARVPLRPSVEWPRTRPGGPRRASSRARWAPIAAASMQPSAYGAAHEPAQPSPAPPVGPPAADQPDQRRHGRGRRARLQDQNCRPACPGSSERDPRPASDVRGRVYPWPAGPLRGAVVVRPRGVRHARPDPARCDPGPRLRRDTSCSRARDDRQADQPLAAGPRPQERAGRAACGRGPGWRRCLAVHRRPLVGRLRLRAPRAGASAQPDARSRYLLGLPAGPAKSPGRTAAVPPPLLFAKLNSAGHKRAGDSTGSKAVGYSPGVAGLPRSCRLAQGGSR